MGIARIERVEIMEGVIVEPGDMLAVTCDIPLSRDQADSIKAALMPNLPMGATCVVFPHGFRLAVLRGPHAVPAGESAHEPDVVERQH